MRNEKQNEQALKVLELFKGKPLKETKETLILAIKLAEEKSILS